MRAGSSPLELYAILRRCWSVETSSKWRPDNPTRGQCSVTSLVVQDVSGGDLLKTAIGEGWHFYNQIGAKRWDLTVSQFATPIGYDDLPASREEVFADTGIKNYELLREGVLRASK
ncbi:YunG family protein [Microvirga alba]|uniref:Uncharacterized protein n=1 Tax=Microvirga alba TaxID=2791025 RepID=A0A931FP12_9HYPH|nr:hypothetical protein [Microvirga alba]MBF9232942.1 hypothetical protein [Microvirga alba]